MLLQLWTVHIQLHQTMQQESQKWRRSVTASAASCVTTTVAQHLSAIGMVTSTRTGLDNRGISVRLRTAVKHDLLFSHGT